MEPQDREEAYLANAAGDEVTLPACPWNRKEAYLADIGDRLDGIDNDVFELNQKVAALATDFSYKGSVADYAHLPSDPAIGDVYTTEDEGYMYVWDGTRWQILNMTGAGALTGDSDPTTATEGTLGQLYLNTTSGKLFYCSATGSTYTWVSLDSPIQSISVNGTAVTPDENKNVALTIPTVNDATLTITQNGTSVGTFTANASTDATIALTDTTYSAFTGATASTAGAAGLVPAPAAGDESKVLKGDGTWGVPDAGIKTLTTADYDYPTTGTATGIAAWTLGKGVYRARSNNLRLYYAPSTGAAYYAELPLNAIFIISSALGTRDALIYPRIGSGEAGSVGGITWNFARLASSTLNAGDAGFLLSSKNIIDGLTSTSFMDTLSAAQGKVLKDLIDSIAIRGAGAPTTSTVGTVGQLYEDGTNGDLYQLKSIDITVTPNTYNWEEVGGGSGPTVVQTTGDSTTDVMSQKAVTSMVFRDPVDKDGVQIGKNSNISSYSDSVAIGKMARVNGYAGVAIGSNAGGSSSPKGSISLGAYAKASTQGQMSIGLENATTTLLAQYGYNGSAYRLLSGVYDGQSAHDAATKGQLDTAIINGGTTAPTTSTAGAVGTQYTYVDTTGAPTAHLCVCTEIDNTDPSNPVYTWSTLI